MNSKVLFVLALLIYLPIHSAPQERLDLSQSKSLYFEGSRYPAKLLKSFFEKRYGIKLDIKPYKKVSEENGIYLSTKAAIDTGIVIKSDLDRAGFDGYVLRSSGNQIVLATNGPQGYFYGTFALMKELGLELYPWHYHRDIEVFRAVNITSLEAISIIGKPFFEYRDAFSHLDQGKWGGNMRQFTLAEVKYVDDKKWYKKGKEVLYWDHTAAFLVPPRLYAKKHPEYYTLREKVGSAHNMAITLCTSNRAIYPISARNALDWIDKLKTRSYRYFVIEDGDNTACFCVNCKAMDPWPERQTDRHLKWVNHIAKSVSKRFPDKVLLTYAYQSHVRPPFEEKPEKNVVVMYCPWFWNSRFTSSGDWSHPGNITTSQEFFGWTSRFPGQIGVYDYPANFVNGMIKRIKFFAKHGVRTIYQNGGKGEFFHYLCNRLMWNPYLDSSTLKEEIISAYFETYRDVAGEYLHMIWNEEEKDFRLSKNPRYVEEAWEKLDALESRLKKDVESPLRRRVQLFSFYEWRRWLVNAQKHAGVDPGRIDAAYEAMERIHGAMTKTKLKRAVKNRLNRVYNKTFKNRKTILTQTEKKRKGHLDEVESGREFDQSVSTREELEAKIAPLKPASATREKSRHLPVKAWKGRWESLALNEKSPGEPELVEVQLRDGRKKEAYRMNLSFENAKTLPQGYRDIKSISLARYRHIYHFETPIDMGSRGLVDLHLVSSRDLHVTVYLNNCNAFVKLHRGEQILRINLNSYRHHFAKRAQAGDTQLRSLGFDVIHPDNFPPYPRGVANASFDLLGVHLRSEGYVRSEITGSAKAIWMKAIRPNFRIKFLVDVFPHLNLNKTQKSYHMGRKISPQFRSFTSPGSLSPIYRILCDTSDAAAITQAAYLKSALKDMTGVSLPVVKTTSAGLSGENSILLGTRPALASGLVDKRALDYCGSEGIAIHAFQGRVVITGGGTLRSLRRAIDRYLELHGLMLMTKNGPGIPQRVPDYFQEVYLLDFPYLKNQGFSYAEEKKVFEGWVKAGRKPIDRHSVYTLAERIKAHAKGGDATVNFRVNATSSPLHYYISRSLCWDPFLDTSELISRFNLKKR